MSKFLIGIKAKDVMVGALEAEGTREEVLQRAIDELKSRHGLTFDLMTSEKVPITQILICEVVSALTPEFRLVEQDAAQEQAQPAQA